MLKNNKSANGTTGLLIRVGDDFMFRVYNGRSFTDYAIFHYDMQITITDPDAYFYDSTKPFIDYSPQSLGTSDEATTI